jgi:hypothetical protein
VPVPPLEVPVNNTGVAGSVEVTFETAVSVSWGKTRTPSVEFQ